MTTDQSTHPARRRTRLGLRTLAMLAWRNLWRNRRRTTITMGMVSVGFALAVVSIGIGDGAHNGMIRNGIRMGDGHITLLAEGYLQDPANHRYIHDGDALGDLPTLRVLRETGAARIAPRVTLQALVSSSYHSVGVGLQGIDIVQDPLVEIIGAQLQQGAWLQPDDAKGVVLGSGVAERLKLRIGSKVVLRAGGAHGEAIERLGRVRGIFHTGLDSLDDFVMVSGLDFTRALLPGDGARARALTRLAVFLDDPEQTSPVLEALRGGELPTGVRAHSWQEMMPELVNFIILDDFGNYIWLMILGIVVVFGILNTMLMSVLDRVREFGLVRALGLRPMEMLRLVLVETVLLAVLATTVGWILGALGHWYLAAEGLDLSALGEEGLSTVGVMMDPILRSELSMGRIVWLTVLCLLTTLLSGLYPAWRASRVSPIMALRH